MKPEWKNGDEILEVWLPGGGDADNMRYKVGCGGVISIVFEATNHGDHEECWAHVATENGDITSVNLRQVTSIVWKPAEAKEKCEP
jgi:hypothetical protein